MSWDAGLRYAAWLAFLMWTGAEASLTVRRDRLARWFWTAGVLGLACHMAIAFQSRYHWSHDVAYIDTADKTGDVTGIRWGGGVWINYAMLAIWSTDAAIAWWRGATAWAGMRRATLRWVFAFIWSQGAVVFPKGPQRWWAALVLVLLAAWVGYQWRRRRQLGGQSNRSGGSSD